MDQPSSGQSRGWEIPTMDAMPTRPRDPAASFMACWRLCQIVSSIVHLARRSSLSNQERDEDICVRRLTYAF